MTRYGVWREGVYATVVLNLLLSDRFASWYRGAHPGERNDHGDWNGQNLEGIDPRAVLLAQKGQGDHFSLLDFVRRQAELCRVLVRATHFPWLKRYPLLIR